MQKINTEKVTTKITLSAQAIRSSKNALSINTETDSFRPSKCIQEQNFEIIDLNNRIIETNTSGINCPSALEIAEQSVSVLELLIQSTSDLSDIMQTVIKFLDHKHVLSFLLVSKWFRSKILPLLSLNKFQVSFTPSPPSLDNGISKLEFVKQNNLELKIVLSAFKDYQNLIDFINNPSNQGILERIRIIEIGNINKTNLEVIQKLMNELNKKEAQLKNLTSLSCGDITSNVTLTLPQSLVKLISFSCGTLSENTTLTFPQSLDKLTSFSCGNICENAAFTLPQTLEKLTSFSCGHIYQNATLALHQTLDNLISFSCGTICSDATLIVPQKLDKLISFSCGDICEDATLTLPLTLDNLNSFSCAH
ncbi:MAG: hypothetical protein C5B43_02855, partial [Verrucomicrobia bacterium]